MDAHGPYQPPGPYAEKFGSKAHMGFEIVPGVVLTIDSLGIIRRDGKFKLRNERFLHIIEDKEADEISTYYEIYNSYMGELGDRD